MKKKQNNNPNKKKHHIFTNKQLNEMFCATPKDTREFVNTAFEMFCDADANLLPDLEYRIHVASFVAGVMETAFELGWNEAMKKMKTPSNSPSRGRTQSPMNKLNNLNCMIYDN